MPIYDYRCTTCGHIFEDVQLSTISDRPNPICTSCNSTDVHRMPSATSHVRYYGDGTYKKDYKDTGDWA